MQMWKKLFLAAIVIFILMQLVGRPPENPPVEEEIAAPPEVMSILRSSCYDCHSNQTEWPWYSQIAPVSWWVGHHVAEAREEMNLSTWNRYSPEKRADKIEEIGEETREKEMPLPSYLWAHSEARLSDSDLKILTDWARVNGGGGDDHDDDD